MTNKEHGTSIGFASTGDLISERSCGHPATVIDIQRGPLCATHEKFGDRRTVIDVDPRYNSRAVCAFPETTNPPYDRRRHALDDMRQKIRYAAQLRMKNSVIDIVSTVADRQTVADAETADEMLSLLAEICEVEARIYEMELDGR